MTKLLSFEFYKRWRSYRAGALGAIVLLVILIPIIVIFYHYNRNSAGMLIPVLLYSLTLFALMFFPPIESLVRFNRDISGRVSVLELSLPLPAWKKVLSKLIATMCTLLISMFVCAASIFVLVSFLNSGAFVLIFTRIVNVIAANPAQFIVELIFALLSFFSFLCVIHFCIALSKSITHKNKIAVPIAITVFIAYIVALSFLGRLSEAWPIVTFKLFNDTQQLSSILFEIVIAALSFFGTSWLVENKIES